MSVFVIKRGDTSPALEAELKERVSGSPADLSGATVRFLMKPADGNNVKVDGAATIFSAEHGLVRYQWLPGDTSVEGGYIGEFEVTYSGGSVETFPNSGYIRIQIIADIG